MNGVGEEIAAMNLQQVLLFTLSNKQKGHKRKAESYDHDKVNCFIRPKKRQTDSHDRKTSCQYLKCSSPQTSGYKKLK